MIYNKYAPCGSIGANALAKHNHPLRDCLALCLIALALVTLAAVGRSHPSAAQPTTPVWQSASDATKPLDHLLSAPMSEASRRMQFTLAWQLVARHYLYADLRGLDWDAVRAEFEPRALAAQDTNSFRSVMGEMIGRLQDSHSRYMTADEARSEDALADGDYGYSGIGIVTLTRPNALVIEDVFVGSPAAAAGLQPRDQILAINRQRWTVFCAERCEIRGAEGTPVQLTIRTPGQTTREVVVERRRLTANFEPSSMRLPRDASIGYLRIPSFFPWDMPAQVEQELRRVLGVGSLSGLVIDLRANGGGHRSVLREVLGNFVSGDVGQFFTRKRATPFTIAKGSLHDQLATTPIIVLVDQRTASAAEIMAAVLQYTSRARIIGIRSAGNVEVIYPFTLTDGARLWLAREGFRLLDGSLLDERGVQPDVEMTVDWADYTERDDPYTAQAVALIRDLRKPE